MTQAEWDSMIADMDEQSERNFERAIFEKKRNIYKVTFRGKSNSKKTLEIFTVATGADKAIKKVLDELHSDKKKYRYVFHHYAVFTYGYDKTEEYKQANDACKCFYAEKHPTAELVTGVNTLFVG